MKIFTQIINEAAAKNVHNPRKGSTVWLLKDGETKSIPVKVVNIYKVKTAWYSGTDGYDLNVEIGNNEYGIDGWVEHHYGRGFDYSDERYQVKEHTLRDRDGHSSIYYVGTSKDVIQQFINTRGSDKLESLLKQIEQKQEELNELMQKKQRAEAEANLEITESLKL